MNKTNAARIINTVKNISKGKPNTNTDIVWGKVESVEPLAIRISPKMLLTEQFLVLGNQCKEQIIKIPTEAIVKHLHVVPLHTTDTGCDAHPHTHTVQPFDTLTAMPEIRLWRNLVVGDNVRMFRIGSGQTYYVIEREEGVPWYDTTAIADNR